MPESSRFNESFVRPAHIPPELNEDTSDFEKYASLISIIKGFEEYTLDKAGFIISSNLEAVTITGYEEWEVMGKHISIFYSLEDQLAGKPIDDLTKAEKRPSLILTGLRIKKRNSSFWAKIKFRALTENGEVIGYKMTLHDATHKAVSDHRVKGFRDEYLSLFNNSFVGIFKFSMNDFSILMMNDKALKLTGLDNYEDKKSRFHEIFDNQDDFLFLTEQIKSHKTLEQWEFKLKNSERWVSLSCRVFQSRNFAEGILVETTELKKSNVELDRLRNELDQLIYHASHELRSPLVSMLGIINLVNIEKNLEASLSLNLILKEKVNQLDELLKDISWIAYNNKNPFIAEDIEWEKMIKSILTELQISQTEKVQFFYTIEQLTAFQSDVARIRTIVRNLVSNSFKYFNSTADNCWANLRVSVGESHAEIMISDNGIGIDQEYVNKIFKMFYKATEYPKGPGLGLYIVKAMTEKLNGSITVESTIGKGTTFRVRIPNNDKIAKN
jgi:PAS domain S-box-containing protein